MSCEQASERILDFIDGALASEERAALVAHLEQCAGCRREVDSARQTWEMLEGLEEPRVSDSMRERFFEMLRRERGEARQARPRLGPAGWLEMLRPGRPVFQAAVALGMLVLGVWLGSLRDGGGRDDAAVRELREKMESMEQAVVLSLLENRSASERLRAVSLTQNAGLDDRVTEALLQTIASDPSVNVRLAALDVLARMAGRPDVQEKLLEAFPRQTSPTMTVAMADVLMAVDGSRSRKLIESTMNEKELPDDVKAYLQAALSKEY